VFKDRDDDDPTAAVLAEQRAVKELFHHCHQESAGVLTIGETRYWLLGWEWPNQACRSRFETRPLSRPETGHLLLNIFSPQIPFTM